MLRQILDTFDSWPGPVSLEALSRRLGIEPAVLDGMLAELVRMGRLVRLDPRAAAACAACGHTNGCPFVLSVTGVYYAVPTSIADGGRTRPALVCPPE